MIPYRIRPFLCCVGLLIIFSTCKKEDFRKISFSNRNPLYAIPLANSVLGFDDLVGAKRDTIINKTGKSITFTSSVVVNSAYARELFPIPAVSVFKNIVLSSAESNAFLTNGTIAKNIVDTLNFPFPFGAMVKSMKVMSGSMNINIVQSFKHDAKININVPWLRTGSQSFAQSYVLNFSGSTPQLSYNSIDLSGYTLNFAFGTSLPQNRMAYSIVDSMTLISGSPLVSSDNTNIEITFTDLRFGDIDGNFGAMSFPSLSSSAHVGLFSKAVSGGFEILDPSLNATYTTSFGFPIRSVLEEYKVQTTSVSMDLLSDTLSNGINMTVPGSKGTFKTRQVVVKESLSNLSAIVKESPKSFTCRMQETANPLPTSYVYFMTDSSRYENKLELVMPIAGKFTGFVLMDTARMDLSAFSKNKIDSLRVEATSLFPLNASLQGYFVDGSGFVLDSLFESEMFISSAEISSRGLVSKEVVTSQTTGISDLQFSRILISKSIIYKITLSMPEVLPDGVETLQLLNAHTINIFLGAQVRTPKK